ncbi:MAG TPA: hypothetical protein PK677_14595, partial [Acidiphilium sp.]|nr:hypothetical protein [Acidiphilium sp.]
RSESAQYLDLWKMGGFVSPETGYVCAGALKARVFTEFLPECGDHLLQYHNFYYSKILEFQSILETPPSPIRDFSRLGK